MKNLLQQIIDIQNSITEQANIDNRLGDDVCITLKVSEIALLSYALGLASSCLLPREPQPGSRALELKPPPVKTKGVRSKR